MSSANDTQVGGSHYVSDYQHWDFVAKCYGSGYFKGVITKYVIRWRKKNGMEDLQKARHYLVKLIELVSNGIFTVPRGLNDTPHFAAVNDLGMYEASLVSLVTQARSPEEFDKVLVLLDELIHNQSPVTEV